MRIGIIGLGRMGSNIAIRLLNGGHQVVGYDRSRECVDRAVEKGVVGAYSLDELIQKLPVKPVVWLMIPAGEQVESTIQALLPRLSVDSIIIDGGNSYYKDTIRRAVELEEKGLHLVDVGTSGGIWGLEKGYCLTVGGHEKIVEQLRPVLESLAPANDKGWGHVGPNGAGHYVKMIHNSIEYGLMESYAEGFAILKRKELDLNLHQIAEIWRYGSVIRSWLLDLITRALAEDPEMSEIEPYVADSGEGRWAVREAIDLSIASPVLSLSLLQRFRSRDSLCFSDKLVAVLREQFGGHTARRSNAGVRSDPMSSS